MPHFCKARPTIRATFITLSFHFQAAFVPHTDVDLGVDHGRRGHALPGQKRKVGLLVAPLQILKLRLRVGQAQHLRGVTLLKIVQPL